MRRRWIEAVKSGAIAIFLLASLLLGLMIGRGSVKACEIQIGKPSTPWAATLRLGWDFLLCFYVFIPFLFIVFAGLQFLSSLQDEPRNARRSDAIYTLVAWGLMLLGLFWVGLRSQTVQW